jgi:predicted lipoprotein
MSLKQWGAVLTGCAALLLTACTVVDLDANGKPILPADPNAKASFDNMTPQQIAQQTWQERVIDAAHKHALDATALTTQLKATSDKPHSVFVHLTSQVERVDVSNEREQKLVMTFNGQPLEVQTGPVIQGNAIRDATGFKFEDFTNQVQFAQLSRAYNRETIKHLPKIDDSWVGKQATLLMAVTINGGKATDAAALELKQEAQ